MIEATGERFIPELMGGQHIEAEHVVRYRLASRFAAGRRVLDAGCGVGWGSVLLAAAGAKSVHGLDIDPPAIEDARQRLPGATFVVGDLTALPWPDGEFDLIVCFEAIEHVQEQSTVLDELARVLSPGGLLLVSSPNPRVYPPGNPFHVHELNPEELVQELRRRVPHVATVNQYSQIASVLAAPDTMTTSIEPIECGFVAMPTAGQDPYSLCIGSTSPLAAIAPIVVLAPSAQLVHLEETARQLESDRKQIWDDHARIVAERTILLSERADLYARLSDADQLLRSAIDDRATFDRQRRAWAEERERLRRDREQTSWMLLETEQQMARLLSEPKDSVQNFDANDLEMLTSGVVVDDLRRQLDAMRASTSWRLTAPLRQLVELARRKGR